MARLLYNRDIKRLDLIREYIMANLDKDLSIGALALLANVGKSTLRRHFLIYCKRSIHQFILECRLNRARELLVHSRLSVAEIATMVGFKERTSLTRIFSRYIGCSPAQFRSLASI